MPDPRHEREAVAEPRVDRVLDVRVRVDEARDDHAAVVALARRRALRPARRRRCVPSSPIATAPSAIGAPSTGTTQSAETTLTGWRPPSRSGSGSASGSRRLVRSSPKASTGPGPQRLSISFDSQIEASKRISSGIVSNSERDGVDRREQDREGDHQDVAEPAVAAQLVVAEDADPDEGEDEDRHLEGEPAGEQDERGEREVVARPDLDVVERVVEVRQERDRGGQDDEVGEDDAEREEAGREHDESPQDALGGLRRRRGRGSPRPARRGSGARSRSRRGR